MNEYSEYSDIQELLAELPKITLPDSLRADALFARLDAQAAQTNNNKPAIGSRIIDITKRLRPVLSYAAVFAVMVLVYYGTGVDKTATAPAPAAFPAAQGEGSALDEASPRAMMAAPHSEEPQSSMDAVPSMVMESAPISEDGADTAGAINKMSVVTDELTYGELVYSVEQLETSVMVTITELGAPDNVVGKLELDGSYSYMGEVSEQGSRIMVATLASGDRLPATSRNGNASVEVGDIHRYPAGDNAQYMVLAVLGSDSDDKSSTSVSVAAVCGSNLILEPVGNGSFMIFSDAKQDATAMEKLKLDSAIIELR